jgi:MIP family channel proteins
MRDAWRHFIAEFAGTFALVFVGSGAIMSVHMAGGSLVEVALAHGLVLAALVTAMMRISAHFNPAITIGFLVTRRIEPIMAAVYVAAQFLGAIAGAYLLKATFPAMAVDATRLGGQMISGEIGIGAAVTLEAVATFLLTFVLFGSAADPRAPRVGGLPIGFVYAAAIVAIGPLTGASLNPARSFGPAIVVGILEGQSAYWIGPIIGAVAAAVLYDQLFMRRGPEPHDHGAIRPE